MKIRHKTYVILLLSTFAVTQIVGLGGLTAYAAQTTSGSKTVTAAETSTLAKVGSIALAANFSVKLDNVNLFAQDGGNILTYTLTYANGSGGSVNLADYFSKAVTPGGSIVKGIPVTADVSKKKVAAKSSQSITYYVNVGSSTAVKGVKIQLYSWNFSLPNFEQRIGTFAVPSNFSASALQGESKKVLMNKLPANLMAGNVQTYAYNGKLYAKVAVAIRNLGTQVLTDPGYTVYLKSSGGSLFELSLDQSSVGYSIQPQEKQTVYYVTEIPSGMKTSGMTLQMVKLDSTLNIYLPVSSFNLPAGSSANLTVQNYATKTLSVDNIPVEMQLQAADVYAENENGIWNLQLRVKNAGNQSVTLPDYELAVKSSEGYLFPLDSSSLASLKLKPLEEKILPLYSSVPLTMDQAKLKLQLVESSTGGSGSSSNSGSGSSSESGSGSSSSDSTSGTGGAGNSNASPASGSANGSSASSATGSAGTSGINLPLAYFNIPYSLQTNSTVGSEYTVKNNYGTFGVSLSSLQRLPWGDKDSVVAKLNIRNTSSKTVTLPGLTGMMKLDMNDLTASTQLINDSDKSVLAPGESTDLYVTANIPYTLGFTQTKIILNSTGDSAQFLSIATANNAVSSAQTIQAGGTYEIGTTRKKAGIKERVTKVYPGSGSNIVYSEIVMTSEETRQANLSRLYGYFKTADGQYYQATANQSTLSTSPGGQTLVTFWAKVPASVDTSGLLLYVGQGVNDGALTEPGAEATGYINTGAIPLLVTDETEQSNLTNVSLFPYSLSVLNSVGSLNQNSTSLSLAINYTLSKDTTYDTGNFEHTLVMQVTDPYGQSFEKTLTPGTDLTVGSNNSFTVSYSSSLYKSLGGGTYRITLYDQFQGQRNELANQTYSIDYVTKTSSSSGSSNSEE